jgi:hypothetical protein
MKRAFLLLLDDARETLIIFTKTGLIPKARDVGGL